MADMKSIFYGIHDYFRTKPEELAEVLAGASCEAWLCTECCLAMNRGIPGQLVPLLDLGAKEYAFREVQKRDISIYRGTNEILTHAIEVKVVYPMSDSKILDEKLWPFVGQIERDPYSDEPDNLRSAGLLFAVWSSYYEEPRSEFHRRVSSFIRELFPPERFTTQHDFALENILDPTNVKMGSNEVQIALAALMLTARK